MIAGVGDVVAAAADADDVIVVDDKDDEGSQLRTTTRNLHRDSKAAKLVRNFFSAFTPRLKSPAT